MLSGNATTIELRGVSMSVLSATTFQPDPTQLRIEVPYGESLPGWTTEIEPLSIHFEGTDETMHCSALPVRYDIELHERPWWARLLFSLGMKRFAPLEPTVNITFKIVGDVSFSDPWRTEDSGGAGC